MPKETMRIGEAYRKASIDSLVSLLRAFTEANKGLAEGIASEMTEYSKKSVGRALEIQSQLFKQASDIYLSEMSKLGRIMFGGALLAREELPKTATNKTAPKQSTLAESTARSRKTGAAKRRSKSVKAKTRSKSKAKR